MKLNHLLPLWYFITFQLLLHNPVETPKIADYGLLISPGREYRIQIKPVINNSTRSLHNVKEEARQCAYSQDKYLKFYQTYTQRNCILECETNYTLAVCDCVPIYLPSMSLSSFFFLTLFFFYLSSFLCLYFFLSLRKREKRTAMRLQSCKNVLTKTHHGVLRISCNQSC